jgi:hypothetical protein
VVEEYLERVPTLLCNADDQHLVIMAQRLRVSGIADFSRDARAALNQNSNQKLSPQVRPST